MKVFVTVLKVLAALAAVAAVVYVIIAHGERIMAWAKSLLSRLRGEEDFLFDEEACYFEEDGCEDADADDFEA